MEGLRRYERDKAISKSIRLLDGRPLWKDEKYMDIDDIENYITHMMENIKDDPAVANVATKLLKMKIDVQDKQDFIEETTELLRHVLSGIKLPILVEDTTTSG